MFSDAEGNASTLLNRAGIVELPLLSTLLAIYQKSREPSLWEVMNSFLINIGKFGSFKNPFAVITSLSELYFRFRRFILLVQMKKVISINYGSSTSCWKPWAWGLTWYFWWRIYTSIPTWTHSQNSLAASEAPSLKKSSHGTSFKWSWSQRLPQSAQEQS